MSLIQQFYSRRFFLRILFTNTLLVVLFLLIFCSVIYFYSRNTTLDLQQEANRKVLNQVNYNIDNLNEMVRNLTISSFNDRDLTSLINSEEIDVFELYNKLSRLDQIVNSNLFVRSVMIFNARNQCVYSTSATEPVLCNIRGGSPLQQFLKAHPNAPKLTLLPYAEQTDNRVKNAFAYLNYSSIGSYTSSDSVMMVVIKPEWLFDNIRMINELADNSLGNVFLMDADGQVYDGTDSSSPDDPQRQEIVAKLRYAKEPLGYFITHNDDGKQIVSYMSSKANQWRVVSIQPYGQVFGKINQIGTFSLFALLAFILLSFFVSALFSVRLYKPMGRLINQLKLMPARDADLNGSDKDELSFLSNVYVNMQNNMSQLRETSDANQHVLYQYFIRKWIADSGSITDEQVKQFTSGQQWIAGNRFILAILKLDDYANFNQTRSEYEKKLCKFAITNITEEIVRKNFVCQVVDMGNDHLILLVQLPNETIPVNATTEIPQLVNRLQSVQDTIHNYYKLSLTMILSDPIDNYKEATLYYKQAALHSQMRMIVGKMAIISPQQYQQQAARVEAQIPDELYKKLVEGIKNKQLVQAKLQLDGIIHCIETFHCENIDDAVMNLLILINQTLKGINQLKLQALTVDLKAYTHQVLEQETLSDVQALIEGLLQEFITASDTATQEKPEFLIGAVKEMVDANYIDANLSLQSIADSLKMSSGYLGRYFRSKELGSVADYINEVRLNHSLRILEQTDDSIVEIMKKVGFTNESSFFKLFKKKIGVTPNEYRLTRSI